MSTLSISHYFPFSQMVVTRQSVSEDAAMAVIVLTPDRRFHPVGQSGVRRALTTYNDSLSSILMRCLSRVVRRAIRSHAMDTALLPMSPIAFPMSRIVACAPHRSRAGHNATSRALLPRRLFITSSGFTLYTHATRVDRRSHGT